jgi:ABC-type nitrate/sulfonate/bicarbonate transport system substrate-binding protein
MTFFSWLKNFSIPWVLWISIIFGNLSDNKVQAGEHPPLRIGYFHGGRTSILMRAYERGVFKSANVDIEIYSKGLRDEDYHVLPPSIVEYMDKGRWMGKATGVELIDGIFAGQFDVATVGEASFIEAISKGKPVVAIAELGHDVKNQSGHAFLVRKGIQLSKPQDYWGKVFIARRAGPMDLAILKEYFQFIGIDLEKEVIEVSELPRDLQAKAQLPKDKVIIVSQVFEDDLDQGVSNGVIDGGYFHLKEFQDNRRRLDLIRPLHDWMNPELSHSLLVCHPDYLAAHADQLVAFLEVYIKEVKYEHSLSYDERTKKGPKGVRMAVNFFGLNYPQYDLIPLVDLELLKEVKDLLVEHHLLDNHEVDIERFIDNRIVEKAAKNLGLTQKDDYWQSEY